MPGVPRFPRSLPYLALLSMIVCSSALAQTSPASRITQPINDQIRVSLKGNVYPLAQARYDHGAVPDSFPAKRMFLLLQRSPEREADLRQFIQDAHTPGSPTFHKWLTPQQFGQLYGPLDSEVAAVSGWLQKHGFSIARVTNGRTAIEFSGTAGELRKGFKVDLHTYVVNGELHHANSTEPQIPAALAPVVAGLTSLNDFPPKSFAIFLGNALYDPKTHVLTPQWTLSATYPPVLAVAPADFALQYDLNPLYSSGVTGAGVTIGIIGASDVDPAAIANYRSFFGLPAGTLNVVIDGSDPTPGEGNWATGESYLDVEIAGAVAPGATINLYTAADTSVQSGLLLAAQRAVDDDQASVLSTSYGTCEQQLGSSGNQFWAALWEQAAAQGQTSFVSAGDNGSAGCDNFNAPQPAQSGLAVSGFSSTPWNISIGGTDFYYSTYNSTSSVQLTQIGTYWNLTATQLPAESLLQPVPEQPWNQAFGLNLYDGGVYNPSVYGPTIVAGSGGASTLYPKPAWQAGTGVPSDGARDLPDVSLFASAGGNGSFYPICIGPDSCMPISPTGFYQLAAVGGTSASSPAMAGIMALINQKYGPQGQASFILYPLATQHPAVFHDITLSSNDVPCEAGTPNCTLSTLNDDTKGFLTLGHYSATTGYDQATGLGSVDANLLIKYWTSVSFTPSNTSLTLNQTTFTHGTPVQMNIAVSGTGGTPSGDIGFAMNPSPSSNASIPKLTLQNGAASATVNYLPGGQYQLTAKYTGDTVFAPSSSTPVPLNVAPEASTLSLSGNTWSNSSNSFVPLSSGGSYPYGTYIALDAQPRGNSVPSGPLDGLAGGTVSFTDSVNGGSILSGPVAILSQQLAEWFPSLTFPIGTNSITATYSGDSSLNPSTSGPFTFMIIKAQPYAFLDAKPSPVALGLATTLDVQVGLPYDSPLPAPPSSTFGFSDPVSPTGLISFTYGSTVIATVPIVPFSGGTYESEVTLSVSSLPLGTDTVTASYSGDANYLPATSSFNVIVEQAPTLTAVANPNSISQAELTAITAAVTGPSGMPVPTGTVSFGAPVGNFQTWSDTEPLVNGTATSKPLAGEDFLGTATAFAQYSSDSTYGPASVNVSFTVTQGGTSPFSLTATPVTIATPGATTGNTSTIGVSPGGGFTGAVYLSCAMTASPVGAQYLPTCSIPPSVNITGATAVTATMTINSTPASTTAFVAPARKRLLPNRPWALAANTAAMLGPLLLFGILTQRRSSARFANLLFLLALLVCLAGCGGGSSNLGGGGGGGAGGNSIPGTTPGTYTFTAYGALSANGVAQAQAVVIVTIQ